MATNTYTALINPFLQNKLDIDSFVKIIENQIANGIDGIVPCGTTGESPTLSSDEHNLLIEVSVATAKNKIKVMAGTGSNSTAEAIEFTKHAKKVGADSCLVVAPYYNKPTPEGIYQHFSALNKLDIPLIIYNIPGRSVINISDVLIAKLANLTNVIGIKDATGDLLRVATLRKLINKDFLYLSGEDGTALGFNAMGGNGIISVTANIAPNLVANLQKATQSNNYPQALQIQDSLTNLHSAMFCETNPGPVKYACSLLGLCSPEIRLPLVLPTSESQQRIQQEMKNLNLI